ncbi:MAG: cysteine hydrolase family protein [Alphaproteobacteria bacterium]|nr:cysteine hydrolase family protein [Alphaproteobacteria bacterium]
MSSAPTGQMPRTLMQMAGASSEPPPLAETALVLIDCQREYVDGALPLTGIGPALAETAKVLAAARAAGAPVIHVVHRGRAGGGAFDPEGPYFTEADEGAALAGESTIEKALPNAFAGTDLQQTLEDLGRKQLLFAGFQTHMCISSTVRVALDLGYASTVVARACATRDLPDGEGGVVAAADLHRASLAALSDRFALVVADSTAW